MMFVKQSARHTPVAIIVVLILVLMALTACGGEKKSESYTVGILNPVPDFQPAVDGFKAGMSERGYTEGENMTYVQPEIASEEALPAVAKTLVEQGVDLIYTVTNGAAEAPLVASDTIPVVAGVVLYPVEAGLADKESGSGRNFAAVDIGPVNQQRLSMLIKNFPGIKKVYVPLEVGYTTAELSLKDIQPLADELGIELVIGEFTAPEQVPPAIASLPDDIDAIYTLPDVFVGNGHQPQWAEAAIERGIPHTSIAQFPPGPVFSYGPEIYANGGQAARLADLILKGSDPATLPIETGVFYLLINLKTVEAAGLEISDLFLGEADEIIRPES